MEQTIVKAGKLSCVFSEKRININHPGSCAILPLLDDETVLLIKQPRKMASGEIIEMLEIPAGTRDVDGESPELCALRELEEETGYSAEKISYLTNFMPTCGYSNEVIHLYLAQDLKENGNKIEDEIQCCTFKLTSVMDMIKNKTIIDGKTIIAVLCYFCQINSDPKMTSEITK